MTTTIIEIHDNVRHQLVEQ